MEPIIQSGFLYKLTPTDYITGASPLIFPDVMPNADWTKYVPTGEKQYKYATFDTKSCTTFSFLNEIETWVNWHLKQGNFSDKQLQSLIDNGYIIERI